MGQAASFVGVVARGYDWECLGFDGELGAWAVHGALAGQKVVPGLGQAPESVQNTYHRYGRWSLLLSWVPIIGDPLTLVAGLMREPLWSFLALVTFAKATRYGVLCWITLGWA